LTNAHKKRLLEIARSTVDTFVKTGKIPDFDEKDSRFLQEEGAFVTLTTPAGLRGCIGHIIGEGPLFRTVRDMAVAAASEDPRFTPVTPGELKDVHVEVSVLSKPRTVKDADEIVLGKHGVIVRRGMQGGVFLPQVATETGWTKERFLSELCSQKAGLPPGCWKDPATRLEVFTAEVFGEKEK
jgi:AmmeMemoRadiSam system protein A